MGQLEPIKDRYGRVQGYLETLPNGDIKAYDWTKKHMGTYVKSWNWTTDWSGVKVANGNVVASLIPYTFN